VVVITLSDLPAVNATLNGASAALLVAGFLAVRRRRIWLHRSLMLSALVSSILFLTSYLYYHAHAGTTRFTATGVVRPVYFTILLTHTVLAIVIVPLVVVTLYRAVRRDFLRHRRIARVTLPVWLYVSVTGIAVYLMLYQLFPAV
jgi:putative membrane protein